MTRRLTETLQRVEDRVAKYSGIPWEHQEQLQLLRYRDGQEYVAHHDGIIGENGGKRIATVLMFLREPTSGGETSFPQGTPLPETKAAFLANKDKLSECGWNGGNGFSVIPKKGEAVLFFSFHINGTNDPFANHASCPTLGGTKYTATKWIHENPFETGTAKTPTCTDERELCPVWAEGQRVRAQSGVHDGRRKRRRVREILLRARSFKVDRHPKVVLRAVRQSHGLDNRTTNIQHSPLARQRCVSTIASHHALPNTRSAS